MKKTILATLCVAMTSTNVLAEEPSAFGAGDLSNPTPYGLTSSERVTLQNKQELKKIAVKSNNQAYEVDSLRERIDGLQSVVESLSRKAQTNKRELAELQAQSLEKTKHINEYELRLTQIIEENTKNITANQELVNKMKLIIQKIDNEYVSKKEFNELVSDVNQFKDLVSKELKPVPKKKKVIGLESMSNAEVAKKAKEFYDEKYYTKGIEYYKHLILKNYKPAYAHFMIGQMNFYRKNYADAISFYKKSASLYSKASYMSDLMLNTAIAMEKTKDYKNAKAFYNAVITKYPGTKQAFTAEASLKYIE